MKDREPKPQARRAVGFLFRACVGCSSEVPAIIDRHLEHQKLHCPKRNGPKYERRGADIVARNDGKIRVVGSFALSHVAISPAAHDLVDVLLQGDRGTMTPFAHNLDGDVLDLDARSPFWQTLQAFTAAMLP